MALLQYRFSVVGMDQLNAALSAHRAQAKAHNRALMQDAQRVSASIGSRVTPQPGGGYSRAGSASASRNAPRTDSPGTSSARQDRSIDAAQAKQQRYWQMAAKRSEDTRLRDEEHAATRAAAAKAREEVRAKRETAAADKTAERNAARAAAAQARDDMRVARQLDAGERALARDKARESARQQREAETARKRVERDVGSEQRRQQAYWRQAQRASDSERLHSEERAASIRRRMTSESVGRATGVGRNVLGAVGNVARVGVGLAAIGGGISLAGAVQDRLENTKIAANLAAQAKTPGRTREVLGAAEQVRGFSTNEALQGLEQWQTITGNLDLGLSNLQRWADLADDTSAGYADLASAAGTLFVGFESKIPDAEKRMTAVGETIRAMAAQGTVGSLELKDLSIGIGELWAAAQKFGSDPVTQMRQMGAMAQIYKGAGGLSASEALTTAQRIPDDIIQNVKKFQAAGISVWAKGKEGVQMRSIPELLPDIFQKTQGRIDKIMGLGFDVRSKRGIEVMAGVWREGEATKKGGGAEAVRERLGRFENLTRSDTDIAKGAAERRQQDDKIFSARIRELGTKLGEAALPEINKLADTLSQLTPSIVDATRSFLILANWLARNPLSGLAAIISGAMLKEIAGAAIGASINRALTGYLSRAASQASVGLTSAGNAGTAMAAGGKAATGSLWKLGAAAAAIPAVMAAVMVAIDNAKALHKLTGGFKDEKQMNREARVRAGMMTPEDALAMDKAQRGIFGKGLGGAYYNLFTGKTDEDRLRDYQMMSWTGESERAGKLRGLNESVAAGLAAPTDEAGGGTGRRFTEEGFAIVAGGTGTRFTDEQAAMAGEFEGPGRRFSDEQLARSEAFERKYVEDMAAATASLKEASADLKKAVLNRSDKPTPGWPS